MYADISLPPAPLPQADLKTIQPGVLLLPPLSRRGVGPGLVLLVPDSNADLTITDGVPSHMIKWAEEGYTIVAIKESTIKEKVDSIAEILKTAIGALASCEKCVGEKVGLVCKSRVS